MGGGGADAWSAAQVSDMVTPDHGEGQVESESHASTGEEAMAEGEEAGAERAEQDGAAGRREEVLAKLQQAGDDDVIDTRLKVRQVWKGRGSRTGRGVRASRGGGRGIGEGVTFTCSAPACIGRCDSVDGGLCACRGNKCAPTPRLDEFQDVRLL